MTTRVRSSFSDTVRREVGGKTDQWWDDEQVAVYDCQERLSNYTYVGVIDIDEFIVPQQDKSYQGLFVSMKDMLFQL